MKLGGSCFLQKNDQIQQTDPSHLITKDNEIILGYTNSKPLVMENQNKNSKKGIFWILIIVSIIIGFIIYGVMKDQFGLRFLVFFSGVPFLLFVTGTFGLLWPKIKPEGDEVYISHALIIGLLFIILFFIHVWVLFPLICPRFAECLAL